MTRITHCDYAIDFTACTNTAAAFARDTLDCGRAPNYWAKNAIQWYCLTLEAQQGMQLGNCTNW